MEKQEMMILNLTQHEATAEQRAQGVFEPVVKRQITDRLNFTTLPTKQEIVDSAKALARIATGSGYPGLKFAMIGGAPYLMPELERALKAKGITPLYAFSERVSEEVLGADGTVTKTNVFKHVGWVEN
jgi:hypothetical protein